jgi:hypothetical protein
MSWTSSENDSSDYSSHDWSPPWTSDEEEEEDAFGPSNWSEDDDEADPEDDDKDDGGGTDKDPRIIHACTVARQQGVKYCICMWSSTDSKRRVVPFQNPNAVACLEE